MWNKNSCYIVISLCESVGIVYAVCTEILVFLLSPIINTFDYGTSLFFRYIYYQIHSSCHLFIFIFDPQLHQKKKWKQAHTPLAPVPPLNISNTNSNSINNNNFTLSTICTSNVFNNKNKNINYDFNSNIININSSNSTISNRVINMKTTNDKSPAEKPSSTKPTTSKSTTIILSITEPSSTNPPPPKQNLQQQISNINISKNIINTNKTQFSLPHRPFDAASQQDMKHAVTHQMIARDFGPLSPLLQMPRSCKSPSLVQVIVIFHIPFFVCCRATFVGGDV